MLKTSSLSQYACWQTKNKNKSTALGTFQSTLLGWKQGKETKLLLFTCSITSIQVYATVSQSPSRSSSFGVLDGSYNLLVLLLTCSYIRWLESCPDSANWSPWVQVTFSSYILLLYHVSDVMELEPPSRLNKLEKDTPYRELRRRLTEEHDGTIVFFRSDGKGRLQHLGVGTKWSTSFHIAYVHAQYQEPCPSISAFRMQ